MSALTFNFLMIYLGVCLILSPRVMGEVHEKLPMIGVGVGLLLLPGWVIVWTPLGITLNLGPTFSVPIIFMTLGVLWQIFYNLNY